MRTDSDVRPFEARKDVLALRFGPFELDLKSGELRKSGVLIKIQHQPLKVLTLLASRPGEVLTREEIQHEVWPDGVFVDFEQSLNFCIRHIRGVLNDSAVMPRYIETLPKRGYRWIAPVEQVRREDAVVRPMPLPRPSDVPSPSRNESTVRPSRLAFRIGAAVVLVVLGAGAAILLQRGTRAPQFRRLTFRRGSINSAHFTSDGQIVLAAGWDGEPTALYTAGDRNPSWRKLDARGREVISVLASGEVLFLDHDTLFRAPLSGGPPKAIAEGVYAADASPDGATLVALRKRGSRAPIEWPLGTVVTEARWPTDLRLSPKGDRIAYLEHPSFGDDRGFVVTVDRKGRKTQLTSEFGSADGLAWSPSGDEIWFTAAPAGVESSLWAVSLSGVQRLLLSTMGRLVVHDVSPDGRVLIHKETIRGETRFGRAGADEVDLSWLDFTTAASLSSDGRSLLFSETGEGGGPEYEVYLRATEASAIPVRLGHGQPTDISEDGRWVATIPIANPDHVDLLPTGPGDIVVVKDPQIEQYVSAAFMPDGESLLIAGFARGASHQSLKMYLEPRSGKATALPEDPQVLFGRHPSPDGKTLFVQGAKGIGARPLAGGPTHFVPMPDYPRFLQWKDSSTVYVNAADGPSARIEAVDLNSGHRDFVRDLSPGDKAGVRGLSSVRITPDAKAWAYSFIRVLADLYVVDGLR